MREREREGGGRREREPNQANTFGDCLKYLDLVCSSAPVPSVAEITTCWNPKTITQRKIGHRIMRIEKQKIKEWENRSSVKDKL